jgi:hypothetical protein
MAGLVFDYGVSRELGRKNKPTGCKLGTIMHPITIGALFALQCFHVLFLALHDWIPLGSLNDVKAVRMANPIHKLVGGTLISLTPFAIGLYASAIHLGGAYPSWLV